MSQTSSPLPRYQEVRRILMDEIQGGKYAVGSAFPTDHELCARFSASRHTVREALRELQREGLIARQQGSGTTVISTALRRKPYVLSLASIEDIRLDANHSRFAVSSRGLVRLGPELAELAGQEVGGRWLRIAGLRYRRGEERPQCWVETLVTPSLADVRHSVDGSKPVYAVIGETFGITPKSIQQIIRGHRLAPQEQKALGAEGESGILVRRTYFDDHDQPFEIGVSLYPAESFVNESWLHRSAPEARTGED